MYKDMPQLLSPTENGDFKLEHFEVRNGDIRAILSGVNPGNYVRLMHRGEVIMSDTYMEKRTNSSFCANAYGDVLIGGLGIGMIIMAIQDDEKVKSITVLEKHQEVIDMITAQLPFNDKVKIICADVFEWKPEKGQKFDCIYMDIWNYVNSDVYQDEMKPLKWKYGRYLKSKEESPKDLINAGLSGKPKIIGGFNRRQFMCDFCEKFDFGSASYEVDKYGARIINACGSYRFPEYR